MPFYLSQWIYKDTTVRQMILQQQNRQEVVRVAIEAFGGKLHSFFFSFDEYDGLCISEFADEETAQACLMTVLGQGAVQRIRTTLLFSQEATIRSIQKAKEVFGEPGASTPGKAGT